MIIDEWLSNKALRYGSLFLLAIFILLPGSSILPLMDRDEPRFAQATQEMIDTEQWIVPYFNEDYRFDKPPLTYWWMRVHYWLLGKSELAARLHSILAAGLAAALICRLGAFFYSARAGWLAGFSFLTCLQVLIHGRLAVADMPMILAVVATMDASCRLLMGKSARRFGRNFWYLTLALAVGFLAKGPVAWAVPILAWALFRWPIGKRQMPWRNLQILPAFGFALVAVAAWGIPALVVTKGEFWSIGIGEHVIDRGLKPLNSRPVIPGVYYLGTVMLSLLPWSAFTFRPLFRGRSPRTDPKRAILLSWYIAPFVIFSFYATQLPHYILPGFAGLFLLLFSEGKLPEIQSRGERHWFWWTTGAFAVVLSAMALALFLGMDKIGKPFEAMIPTIWFALGIFILFSVLLPLAIYFWKKKLARVMAGFSPVVGLVLGVFLVDSIRENNIAIQLKDFLDDEIEQEGWSFCSYRYGEPSQVFYIDSKEKWRFVSKLEWMENWLSMHPKEGVAIFRTRVWRFDQLLNKNPATDYDDRKVVMEMLGQDRYDVHAIEGFNAARTTWEEVLVAIPKSVPAL